MTSIDPLGGWWAFFLPFVLKRWSSEAQRVAV